MPLPKFQTAIEIINEVIVPQVDANTKDIQAITKEVVSNEKNFKKDVTDIYNTLEKKEEATEAKMEVSRAEYVKYCKELENEIKDLAKRVTPISSKDDIGKMVDELAIKVEALENEENFEYDDQELKDAVTKLNVDFNLFKEKALTSQSVVDEINSKEGVIEASSIKGLVQTLNNIANLGNNSNVKVAGSILEVLNSGISVLQGATRLNFTGGTVTNTGGTLNIPLGGGGGSPGGSTTQLQYNNAGAFGGISNVLTDGTNLGLGTSAPTHALTLATGNAISLYNTADQTTNYERAIMTYASNVFEINSGKGGTGTQRAIKISAGATNATLSRRYLQLTDNGVTGTDISFGVDAGATGIGTVSNKTFVDLANVKSINSAGVFTFVQINPNISQTSTAGYTALLINPTETTPGSGTKSLILAQVGGVDKFSVANTGITTVTNTTDTASNQILNLKGARATPAANDEVYQSFSLNSSTGVTREFARITARGTTVTNASEAAQLRFSVISAGALSTNMLLSPTTLQPVANDGLALGSAAINWSDLFLATGGVINWNNGNATLTHSTGLLTSNVPVVAPQIVNTPATITVTTNAGTVTRANKINNFTNSSAATMTITMSTTSAADGDTVIVRIKDFSAATQTITWVNTENSTVTAPTTSNGSTTLPLTVGFMYNSATSKWRCIASA